MSQNTIIEGFTVFQKLHTKKTAGWHGIYSNIPDIIHEGRVLYVTYHYWSFLRLFPFLNTVEL